MLFCFLVGIVLGFFIVLLIQGFVLYLWVMAQDKTQPTLAPQRTKAINPKLVEDYCQDEGATEKESCMCLNLLLSFLWKEWKDTPEIRNFFLRKMNIEFQDLLNSRTAGKIIEQISIRDFSLGNSLPVIKGSTVMKIGGCKDASDVPWELDVALDLEYNGGFLIAIEVDLLFGKSAYLAVKLAHLTGRGRLQFSRQPCTHWSFAFYEEPEMRFEVESQFDGRTIPQLTSLIVNHLKRSIRKKHTLPNYRVRYLPFFREVFPQDASQEVYVHNSLLTVGHLKVEVIESSRLPLLPKEAFVYCTLYISETPWEHSPQDRRSFWPTYEVTISKDANSSIGITLSSSEELVIIDCIIPQSPAGKTLLAQGDVVVSIDNIPIDSPKKAAKIIKAAGNKIVMSVQRPPKTPSQAVPDQADGVQGSQSHSDMKYDLISYSNDNGSDSEEEFLNIIVPLLDESMNPSAVKNALSNSPDKRKSSLNLEDELENTDDRRGKSTTLTRKPGDSQLKIGDNKNTELPSSGKQKLKGSASQINNEKLGQAIQREPTKPEPTSAEGSPSSTNSPRNIDIQDDEMHKLKTKYVPAKQDCVWRDIFDFDLDRNHKYLNLFVWGSQEDKTIKDVLLGYVNIPLVDIAVQSSLLRSHHHEQCYVLKTPDPDRALSNHMYLRLHSGLREKICSGDITLWFHHTPSLQNCDEASIAKDEPLTRGENTSAEMDWESDMYREHEYVGTLFYFPTRCDYCKKKIWSKRAFQCCMCGIISHRRCLENCSKQTSCSRNGYQRRSSVNSQNRETRPKSKRKSDGKIKESSTKDLLKNQTQSNRLMKEPIKEEDEQRSTDDTEYSMQLFPDKKRKSKIGDQVSLERTEGDGDPEAELTNSEASENSQSREKSYSFFEEIQITPLKENQAAEKEVIPENPIELAENGVDDGDKENQAEEREVQVTEVPVVTEVQEEKVQEEEQVPAPDEELLVNESESSQSSSDTEVEARAGIPSTVDTVPDMATAAEKVKKLGREMFLSLPVAERKTKILEQMKRLQEQIDNENERRMSWIDLQKASNSERVKTGLKHHIEKSEERSQALAMLMLQYCSGLQNCSDIEDSHTYQL